jgi:hypothetical protein
VHSEALPNQDTARSTLSYLRETVEENTGTVDPYRSQQDKIETDIHGFLRVYRAGPPTGEDVKLEDFAYWFQMIMDIHRPIIVRFGRYPYRNSHEGRYDTEEEIGWLEETGNFNEITDEDVKGRIKEDVLASRWTPLKESD